MNKNNIASVQELGSKILTEQTSKKVYVLRLKQIVSNPDSEAATNIEANVDITESMIAEKNLSITDNATSHLSSINQYPELFDVDPELTHSSFKQTIQNISPEILINQNVIEKAEKVQNDVISAVSSSSNPGSSCVLPSCLRRSPIEYLPDTITELPESLDRRESIVSLPSSMMSEDLSLSSNSVATLIEQIIPIPPLEDILAPSPFQTQARGVRISIGCNLERILERMRELNDSEAMIARFQAIRRNAIGFTGRSDLWYQPGDPLPQSTHLTVFKFILTKIFGIFTKDTLLKILEFLRQTDLPLPDNGIFLSSLSTIFLIKILKPLLFSILPPTFWSLSFFKIKQTFILIIENLLNIMMDSNRNLGHYLQAINLNFNLSNVTLNVTAELWLHGQQLKLKLAKDKTAFLNRLSEQRSLTSFLFSKKFILFVFMSSGCIVYIYLPDTLGGLVNSLFTSSTDFLWDLLKSFFDKKLKVWLDKYFESLQGDPKTNPWNFSLTSVAVATLGVNLKTITQFFKHFSKLKKF